MANWNLLPIDILNIVFEYVVLDNGFWTNWHRTEAIRSCQQTCKRWAVIAQVHLYKYVKLDTYGRAELFIHSLRNYNLGYLVKTISFNCIIDESNRQKLSSLIRQIGSFCSNLKKLETSSNPSIAVWKCIQIERSKGAFSKLQVISPPYFENHQLTTQYYEVAYCFRETLRELTLYVRELSPPIENLEFFTNINTLYFKLDSLADVYKVDQQSKRCSSVEVIDIEAMESDRIFYEEHALMRDARISSFFRICPQVKQLFIRDIPFDSKLCGYLMNIFPNLDKLEILELSDNILLNPDVDRMPNNTAHRFLSYLMKMSSASIDSFPVEDLEDLLMNFHDINGMNKHLCIRYTRYKMSSINIKISAKQKIDIEVMNLDGRELVYLPRLGMIEKSGKAFQSLTVDLKQMRKNELDTSYSRTDLYHILFYCPNIKNICIINVLLPSFSSHEHQRLRLSLHTLKIDSCCFGPEYLRDLSYHVNYIHELTIREDAFFGSRVINMPETELYSISYLQKHGFHRIFLKLKKTVDDSVGWYVSKNKGLERCTEEVFEASVRKHFSMSIFICCIDVRMIELGTVDIKVTFKP